MKLEPCIGCGRMILTHSIANLTADPGGASVSTVKCDPTPLDGQGVAEELGAGRHIWTPDRGAGRLKPARPGDPELLREHRCAAVSRPGTPPPVSAPPKGPERPTESRVAPSAPSSARLTARSGVQGADRRRSECSLCGHPIELADVESYVMIELGATVIDAFHVGSCPEEVNQR